MEERLRTELTSRGLRLHDRAGDEREVDLFAGAIHYWRLAPKDWRPCLRAARDLGLRAVDTYVPWGVHADDDRFVWDGARDLGRFLDEVADAGLLAILRPGPHINAELTYFGFPEHIVADPTIQAVTARGTPAWLPAPPRMFPVPSYAAATFQVEVARWFSAAADVIGPRLFPDGPVAAIQVDNELQMFFRVGAYDLDYHPDALVWWRDHAGDLEPPRAWDPDDPGRCVRWVEFKEEYAARALQWLANALRSAGLGGVAFFHNAPPGEPTLVNLPRVARAIAGPVGMDFYHRRGDYEIVRERALYLAGSAAPLPLSPEVGCGGSLWLPAMDEGDQQRVILGLLAAGVRGLGLFMLVDRDRWYGAPVARDGSLRGLGPWLRQLLTVLDEIEWTSLRRRTEVAVIASRADARFAVAASVADPLTPVVGEILRLGPAGAAELSTDREAREHRLWMRGVCRALARAQVPYDIVDEACAPEALSRYRALVLPTLSRVDRALWTHLRAAAEDGIQVVFGPGAPARDESGDPLGEDAQPPVRAGRIRVGSLGDLEGLADDFAALAGGDSDDWTAPGFEIDCSAFADPNGRVRAVFVGNRTAESLEAEILAPPRARLEDAISGEHVTADTEGVWQAALAPYDVRMFLVR